MANSTTIIGTPITPSTPIDPDICRISGRLLDIFGRPLKGYSITLRNHYIPLGIGTQNLILREQQTVKTDANGYLSFDLYQGSQVEVELPNLLPTTFILVHVPERSNADLVDVLFPYIITAEWGVADPLSVVVGEIFSITVNVTMSDGQVLDLPIFTTSSSSDLIAKKYVDSSSQYQALAVGTAEISLDSIDEASLGLNEESDGTPLNFTDLPSPTLPTPLTVNVT